MVVAVADRRTETTELATGLGMLGAASLADALADRPAELVGVDDPTFDRLRQAVADPSLCRLAASAFANGAAFRQASDGLRGRRPARIEWKGPHRPPGYDLLPADLRVDHVYLVSCKYQSRLLVNASPAHLFDRLLQVRDGDRPFDWYEAVAPEAYQALYEATRAAVDLSLPRRPGELTPEHRRRLQRHCARRWPPEVEPVYHAFCSAVSSATADRWRASMTALRQPRALLWRLLRLADCPYYVLGASGDQPLRLRIETPWDWQQRYRLVDLQVAPSEARQPRVEWQADVVHRSTGRHATVCGHVEVRWSHGRFSGMPEAKVYLDTPHHLVPGYAPLDHPGAVNGSGCPDHPGCPDDPGCPSHDGAPEQSHPADPPGTPGPLGRPGRPARAVPTRPRLDRAALANERSPRLPLWPEGRADLGQVDAGGDRQPAAHGAPSGTRPPTSPPPVNDQVRTTSARRHRIEEP